MAKQIKELYQELAKADKDLSSAKQNYANLQDQLTKLESSKHVGSATIANLQKDIHTLHLRLTNNELAINNECSELEKKYGDLVSGNSLPDTFEELLDLRGEEKLKADQVLKRIVTAHRSNDDDYTLDGYADLQRRLHQYEQESFEAQLHYGQLPESVDVNGARQTSHVEAGGIYYFQAWNAFSLNFREMDISPYKVYVIGKTDIQTTELENAGHSLMVDILK